MSENGKNSGNNKVKLDIFVPLNACACMFEGFLNQVFSNIMEYVRLVQFETKNLDSDEAKKLNLHGNSVVIDGEKIITSPYKLKRELKLKLKEKGLI
ncbi:MAG: hypothetical protein ACTSQO_00910 [Candidatus Helarchaeota archaeon]